MGILMVIFPWAFQTFDCVSTLWNSLLSLYQDFVKILPNSFHLIYLRNLKSFVFLLIKSVSSAVWQKLLMDTLITWNPWVYIVWTRGTGACLETQRSCVGFVECIPQFHSEQTNQCRVIQLITKYASFLSPTPLDMFLCRTYKSCAVI